MRNEAQQKADAPGPRSISGRPTGGRDRWKPGQAVAGDSKTRSDTRRMARSATGQNYRIANSEKNTLEKRKQFVQGYSATGTTENAIGVGFKIVDDQFQCPGTARQASFGHQQKPWPGNAAAKLVEIRESGLVKRCAV